MEIWDLLNNLYHKRFKYPDDNEISGKIWMLNKFLSMEIDLLLPISEVSRYMFTLGNRYYRLLYRLIPQSSSPRNKYIKPKSLFDNELVEKYSDYFGLGKRETIDYLKILKKDSDPKDLFEFVGLEYKSG